VVHGAPLGEEELTRTKGNLGWPLEPAFYVPDNVRVLFQQRKEELKKVYENWKKKFTDWQKQFPELAEQYRKAMSLEIPSNVPSLLKAVEHSEPKATRVLSGETLQILSKAVPFLVGGAADLAPSTNTLLKGYQDIAPGEFQGRNFHFGIREHAMGGILNGIALYGGFLPFGATFLVFSDYMRPSIRLAAMMKLPVIYVFTHDSIFIGEDGPTHQPVEHLASLRAIPNLTVIRPADGFEVREAWYYAISNRSGPTALILTRQKLEPLPVVPNRREGGVQKGGYIISPEDGDGKGVLVASGSEVGLAIRVQKLLREKGQSWRVVSVPSWEIFLEQPPAYQEKVLGPKHLPAVVLEAAVSQGWFRILQRPFLTIGMETFGASAPYTVLAEKFGFTPEAIVEKILQWIARQPRETN